MAIRIKRESPVTVLPGVGKVRAACYERLGIRTLGDLLSHYPRAYENRGDLRLLANAREDGKSAVLLTVATEPKIVRLRSHKSFLKFRAFDESASCEIVYFNQDYLKSAFHVGEEFRFWGKVDRKGRNALSMSSPVAEPWLVSKRPRDLCAVWRMTEGLSRKQIEKDILAALELLSADTEDPLPASLREERSLCTLSFAERNIHEPESAESLLIARRRLVYQEFFEFALGASIARGKTKTHGAPICRDGNIDRLLALLPYRLTNAQLRVIDEVRRDMSTDVPMSRMIVGDVGCGKTVCAAAAILFAVQSGRQAALMAPTEILARQHYLSLKNLFDSLGIKCELLLGATAAKEKRRIYDALRAEDGSRADVVIGTHALLSEGVEFSSLALAVIDEQHRFGVAQRSALSQKNPLSHTLVMSATPIPRSLALALYGDLDVSMIDEIPSGRQAVDTFVVDESYRARLNGFIRKQAESGGQVYVVCPAVEESEEDANLLIEDIGVEGGLLSDNERPALKSAVSFSEELAREFPDLRVDFLHGKLKPKEKEEKMALFVNGKTDVLVSTTVIEVGVNVPKASLMIVENAERFGLSQLHQLRGRVGRGERKSYCVFVSDSIKRNGKARERLMTIKNSTDGYHIAEKDLSMRGPGDFLSMRNDLRLRQSGGLRFKLAELCDDTGLLTLAFAEAKDLLKKDPSLASAPLLRREVEHLFSFDNSVMN